MVPCGKRVLAVTEVGEGPGPGVGGPEPAWASLRWRTPCSLPRCVRSYETPAPVVPGNPGSQRGRPASALAQSGPAPASAPESGRAGEGPPVSPQTLQVAIFHFSGLFVLLCLGLGSALLSSLALPRIRGGNTLQYWLHTSQARGRSQAGGRGQPP